MVLSPPNDIEPILQIPDNSPIYFSIIIVAIVIFLYFTIKTIQKISTRPNRKKEIISQLKNIDFQDAKKSAYLITQLGREVAKSERSRKLLEELIQSLETYKYRPNVPEIDEVTKSKFHIFLEVVESE